MIGIFLVCIIRYEDRDESRSKQAKALTATLSQAWINFAQTGNPNHPGLLAWPTYNERIGATMIFDNVSEVKNHPDKRILEMTIVC